MAHDYEQEEMTTRVLLVCDVHEPAWARTIDFVRWLNRLGVEVSLTPTGALTDTQRRQASRLHSAELFEMSRVAREAEGDLPDKLLALEQRIKPDVVHVLEPCLGGIGWKSPVLATIERCEITWTNAVRGKDITGSIPRYWSAVAKGVHNADLVVAPTEDYLRKLGQVYGRPKRSLIIYSGHCTREWDPTHKREVVVAVGDWRDASHNLQLCDRIAAMSHWPVYLAARNGPEVTTKRPSGLRSTGDVNLTEQAAILGRGSIAIFPAMHDATGLAPLQAAAAHCALVLADIPAFREVWGEAAVYATPNDPGAFAHAINTIAASAFKRTQLSQAAHARAGEYTSHRMAREYADAYVALVVARKDALIHDTASIA